MKWVFPPNMGGVSAGFNDSSIDTFNGEKLFSVVRESIQNSMDARLNNDQPVKVSFSLRNLNKSDTPQVSDLLQHLEYARRTAQAQHGAESEAANFFDRAGKKIQESTKIPFFAISDYNTKGLEGPTDDRDENAHAGPWYALVKASGLSIKSDSGALGSFGHGSKAPFAISELRTVFYLSKIAVGQLHEDRFQGKSILQSMRLPNGEMTQGTGYYSKSEKCDPLLNSEIPIWAQEFRQEDGTGTGTTVFVPFPDFANDPELFWHVIRASVICNFYLAIKNGVLEVSLNGERTLDSISLFEEFEELLDEIEKQDPDTIESRYKYLDCPMTIQYPSDGKKGILISESFGRISWFMRVGGEIAQRKVGIARQNGMIITESAPKLLKFPGTKPFSLFICVEGAAGTRFLRSLEDPTHTMFQFDRLAKLSRTERKSIESAYSRFADEIRDLVREQAGVETEDEVLIEDLNDFFSGAAGDQAELGDAEISSTIIIGELRTPKETLPKPSGETISGGDGPELHPGEDVGDNTNATDGGKQTTVLASGSQVGGKTSDIPARNSRLVQIPNGTTKIYFDSPRKGNLHIGIGIIGEQETKRIKFSRPGQNIMIDSTPVSSTKVGERIAIEVSLPTDNYSYAYQVVILGE